MSRMSCRSRRPTSTWVAISSSLTISITRGGFGFCLGRSRLLLSGACGGLRMGASGRSASGCVGLSRSMGGASGARPICWGSRLRPRAGPSGLSRGCARSGLRSGGCRIGSLHGKAWIVTEGGDSGVIAGSANFTFAGLTQNLELNLGQYQPGIVERVRVWFDELWEQAAPFDLAALYDARFEPYQPWLILPAHAARALWEEIEQEADAMSGGVIRLTRFQEDGVWRAKRIMERHNGVLVADEVGLGKTFSRAS